MRAVIVSSADIEKYRRLDPAFYIALDDARQGVFPDVALDLWLEMPAEKRQLLLAVVREFTETLLDRLEHRVAI